MNSKIHTQTSFCQTIERIVFERKITYLEAIVEYTNENNLEPQTVSKLLNTIIKQKLEMEASDLNLIHRGKKPAKLF